MSRLEQMRAVVIDEGPLVHARGGESSIGVSDAEGGESRRDPLVG